jgi:hypothetical protein
MNIAYISSDRRGEIDRLLADTAENLSCRGLVLSGLVKDHSHTSRFENGCDMRVRVLPDGPSIPITQSLGLGSGSCRLDPGAIAEAVSLVERNGLAQSDLLILNKFGPEEAAGRGFCSIIGTALEHDIPVLVGVSRVNIEAFERFASGMADVLPAEPGRIFDWCLEAAGLVGVDE